MMNKFQEALDWSFHNLTDIHEDGKNELSFEAIKHLTTLQELIDNYYDLIKMFREQSASYANRIMYSVQLEKEIKKACKLLEECTGYCLTDIEEVQDEQARKELENGK